MALRVVLGDSRRMPELRDASVHLVVTSPPYPMIAQWDGLFASAGCETYDDMHAYLAAVWRECHRVLVDGGICCINVGDATRRVGKEFKLYPNHARVLEACERLGFRALPYILWKKPTNKPNAFLGSGFLPPNAYVTLDCEFILLLRKGGLRRFPPHDAKRYASTFTRKERDKWFSQIWEVRGTKQGSGRTAAFPEEVPRRLIRMFSCEGDLVLDPFLGTGTTMRAAGSLGRSCIGYELPEAAGLLELGLDMEVMKRGASDG